MDNNIKDKLNSYQVTGFTDDEGCFYVRRPFNTIKFKRNS